MNTHVAVLVSKCVWDRHAESWRVWERVSEQDLPSLEAARNLAESLIGAKLSVIVRPSYNEEDPQGGRFFREWRSMNGEGFHECRWDI